MYIELVEMSYKSSFVCILKGFPTLRAPVHIIPVLRICVFMASQLDEMRLSLIKEKLPSLREEYYTTHSRSSLVRFVMSRAPR